MLVEEVQAQLEGEVIVLVEEEVQEEEVEAQEEGEVLRLGETVEALEEKEVQEDVAQVLEAEGEV